MKNITFTLLTVLLIVLCILTSMRRIMLYASESNFKVLTTRTKDGVKTETFNSSQMIRIINNDKITDLDLSPDTEIKVIVQLKESASLSNKKVSIDQITAKQAQIDLEIQSLYSLMSQRYSDVSLPIPRIRRQYKRCFNGIAMTIPQCMLSPMRKLNGVRRVFIDREVKIINSNNSGLASIKEITDASTYTGKDVVIGIIDTGIDYTHPALGGGFGDGYKVIGGWDVYNQDADPIDDQGHGTHVAGIAAGKADDWHGIAPDAKLMAFKVLSESGNGSMSDIIAGIERAVDPDGDPETDDAVDIINMSFGGSGSPDDPMCQAVNNAVNSGVICVVAAGNKGTMDNYQSIDSPGVAREAITVGATEFSQVAIFSSKGPTIDNEQIKPDILAPGVDIESSVLDWKTEENSGTSMSSPYIAGVAALFLQAHPDWTPQEIKGIICGTATDFHKNVYYQGSGKVDFNKAQKTTTTVIPNNLGLGFTDNTVADFQVDKYITIKNLNSKNQNYTLSLRHSLPAGVNVTLDQISVNLDGGEADSVRFTISLNPQQFPLFENFPGNFEGWIDIKSEIDDITVPFSLLHFPNLKLQFNEVLPFAIDLIKKARAVADQFSRTIESVDSDLSLNIPLGEYYLISTFRENLDLYYSIQQFDLSNTNKLNVSRANAKYKMGFEIPEGANINLESKIIITKFEIEFSGANFRISRSFGSLGFDNVYISQIDSCEEFHAAWQGLAKEKQNIYFGSKIVKTINESLAMILDDQLMRSIDYQAHLNSITPDNLDHLSFILALIYPSGDLQLLLDDQFFLAVDPLNPYHIFYYPEKEETSISRLRIDMKHTLSLSFDEVINKGWSAGYLGLHEDHINVLRFESSDDSQGVTKIYPLSEKYNYFGMGIGPIYPKHKNDRISQYIVIPDKKYFYQAGDLLAGGFKIEKPYKIYEDTTLVEESVTTSSFIKLDGRTGKLKVAVDYPDIINIGDATGDARYTMSFDTKYSDDIPPNLVDFRLLSNNTFINPNVKPENVVAQVQFDDEETISNIKIQCKASGADEWIDLPTTQDGKWTFAPFDDALFSNNVDVNLIAEDSSGNITEYAMLPAYINQGATRISDVKIIPEIVHPAENIILQAKIVDDDGITSAAASVKNANSDLIDTIALFDDGNHNDGQSGDHIYANQWTTPGSPVDLCVDFVIVDHLNGRQIFANQLKFTTEKIPVLKLVNDNMWAKPGKIIGDVGIQNIGEAKASDVELTIRCLYNEDLKYNCKIDSLEQNEIVKISIPFKVPIYLADGRKYDLIFEMAYNDRNSKEYLKVTVKGTCFEELRAFPQNSSPGDEITIDGVGVDPDDIVLVKASIINADDNSVVDSFELDVTEKSFQGKWTTPDIASNFILHAMIQDGNGNVEIDSSCAFTTIPLPSEERDLLFIGASNDDPDQSLTEIGQALRGVGQSYIFWDNFFRGECDFMLLDKYRKKGIFWQPEVYFPTQYEIQFTHLPDHTVRYKIKRALDKGGCLFMARSVFAEQARLYDRDLLKSYLGFTYQKSSHDVKYVVNDPSDKIFSGLKLNLKENARVDFIKVEKYSAPIFVDENGNVAGVRNANDNYRAIFLGFNFSDIADEQAQQTLIDQSLKWLRSTITDVNKDTPIIPKQFALLQNYPNPFNPETTIRYELPKAAPVTIKIYDLLGREVVALLDKELKQAGSYSVIWNGKNNAGTFVSSGIYLCRFEAGSYKNVMKMAFIK